MGLPPYAALSELTAAADDGRLEAVCRRQAIRLLSVFGSAARAGGKPRDLDVAIRFEPGRRGDLLSVHDELARLFGSDELDLLVLDDAGPVAKERALVGSVALYESEPGAYATAQMAAMCERMETEWLRRLDLEAMARQ